MVAGPEIFPALPVGLSEYGPVFAQVRPNATALGISNLARLNMLKNSVKDTGISLTMTCVVKPSTLNRTFLFCVDTNQRQKLGAEARI